MKELTDYQRRYLEPSQTSETELYSKIVNSFQLLTISTKSSILRVFDWILNTSLSTVCKLHCDWILLSENGWIKKRCFLLAIYCL